MGELSVARVVRAWSELDDSEHTIDLQQWRPLASCFRYERLSWSDSWLEDSQSRSLARWETAAVLRKILLYGRLKTEQYRNGRMVSSGMLRRVALVRTDVSEVFSASFIRVTRIGELGTTLAVTSNRRALRRNTKWGAKFLQNVGSYKSHTA
jgi:hypothetical protein